MHVYEPAETGPEQPGKPFHPDPELYDIVIVPPDTGIPLWSVVVDVKVTLSVVFKLAAEAESRVTVAPP